LVVLDRIGVRPAAVAADTIAAQRPNCQEPISRSRTRASRPVFFALFLRARAYSALSQQPKDASMMDLVYLALLIGFFALSAAIVYGCERLRRLS